MNYVGRFGFDIPGRREGTTLKIVAKLVVPQLGCRVQAKRSLVSTGDFRQVRHDVAIVQELAPAATFRGPAAPYARRLKDRVTRLPL
jgi:hypothetical protein